MSIRSGCTGREGRGILNILWFETTRPYAKCVATAPDSQTVVGYSLVGVIKMARKSILTDEFVVQKDKIYHKASRKSGGPVQSPLPVKASKEERGNLLV